ncbi:MAG: hypothetical protein QNJ89_01400 [Acidimicrobiia bacterium]|nr:hypothetical protein [Acidimicrobiia bacterium]
MLERFKNSPIPIWVNVFLVVIVLLMTVQVFWYYFNHQYLLDAGITIEGDPDKNVLYTTAGRLVAMIGASIFVLITQNPAQHAVVWFMSILREGQEMFIDPLFPYANSPAAPIVDFGMHVVIVALQIAAFVTVSRLAKQERRDAPASALT